MMVFMLNIYLYLASPIKLELHDMPIDCEIVEIKPLTEELTARLPISEKSAVIAVIDCHEV